MNEENLALHGFDHIIEIETIIQKNEKLMTTYTFYEYHYFMGGWLATRFPPPPPPPPRSTPGHA